MPKQYRQEDEVTSADMNALFGDSLPGYETEAERTADWQTPISDLAVPEQRVDIPLGQQSVVGGANPFYGAWNGAAWRPWNRHTPAETGLIQVAVGDITVEESVSGTVTARFPVRLINARGTILNWTDPTYHITAGDLGSRVIRCSARAVEYDPRPYGERTRDVSYTEAVAGSDFLPTVVDLSFLPGDANYLQFVEVVIYSNPEDRGALPDGRPRVERFQLELYNFRGVKPLKDIGICSITSQQLPQLRLEDVTIATDRTSETDPNIGDKTYTVPISLSQAPGVDINLQVFTEDGTAVATAGERDYDAFRRTIRIAADATSPATPLTGTLPNQILEATEHFFVTARPVQGNQPPIIFTKPRARITIQGRALLPRVSAPAQAYGPGFGINPLSPRSDTPTNLVLRLFCDPAPTAETGPVRVRWSTDNTGTGINFARRDYHYIPASGAVTFGVGETTKDINVSTAWTYRAIPTDPDLYKRSTEVDLRINLNLDPGDRDHAELAQTQGTIQLYGRTAATVIPVFTAQGATVDEGRPAIVNVELNTIPQVGSPATVDWRILTTGDFGNAIPGTHYNPSATSGTFSFPGGGRDVTRSIRIPTIRTPGATIPNPRYFTIQFQNAVGCTLSTRSVIVTIREAGITADRPLVTANDLTITEPAGTGQNYGITLVLGDKIAGNTQPYFVDFATKEGSALANTNYVPLTRTRASWTASGTDNTYTVVINVLNNNIREPKEFYLDLGERVSGGSHSGNLELAGSDRYVIRILPRTRVTTALPSMSAADVRVNDNAGNARITCNLSGPAPAGASVNYVTQDGTGRAGTNYTAVSGTLEFPTGGRTAYIDVPVLPDPSNTDDHTFRVLFSGENQVTLSDSRVDVTVVNTGSVRPPPEPEQPPVITIADTRIQNPASGTATANLTISTSRTGTAISGTISTFPDSAQEGTHYTALSRRAWTIPATSSSVQVPVTILSSTLTANVSFTATLVLDEGADATIGDSTARITITQRPEPTTIRVSDLDLTGSSRTGSANVTITRTGDLREVSFNVETVNETARSGQHFRGFSPTRRTLPRNAPSLTIPVPLITPTSTTPVQTFRVRVSNLSSGRIAKADGIVTLPAYTPAPRALPVVTFSNRGAVIEPGAGGTNNSEFVFLLNQVSSTSVSGVFQTSDINSAVAGRDYTATRVRWRIAPGSRGTTIRVPILHDLIDEGRERFRATATIDSGNANFPDGTRTATATGLIDNRAAAVALAVDDVSVTVRGANINVPVRKIGTTTQNVSFQLSTYDTNSATAGEDYLAVSNQTGIIRPDATSTTVLIRTLRPRVSQGIEDFGVRLSNPQGAVITDSTARITLPAENVPQLLILINPIMSIDTGTFLAGTVDVLRVYNAFPVVLTQPASSPISFDYNISLQATVVDPVGTIFPLNVTGRHTIPAGRTTDLINLRTPGLGRRDYYRWQKTVGLSRTFTLVTSILAGLGTVTAGAAIASAASSAWRATIANVPIAGGAGSTASIFITQLGTLQVGVSVSALAATGSVSGAFIADALIRENSGLSQLSAVSGLANTKVIASSASNILTGQQRTDVLEALGVSSLTTRITISRISGADNAGTATLTTRL